MNCDDSHAQTAIGQVATPATVDRIVAESGSRSVRVIKPGMMVTMDYREDRINIHVDAENVITSVKCG